MSPGRKPSRSPASTAGRVRITRLTSPRERAAAAIATARKVLPVPAGPIPKVIVCLRIESTYPFWLTVFGAIRVLRCCQMTSSRISAGLSCWSSAPVTASIVPGAISWPCSIRSTSSPTTVSAVRTSPASPSRVRTLPRRKRSTSRCPSRVFSTASSEPASSAATVLSIVSCLRAKLLAHRLADPLAVGAAADLRHQHLHDAPHVLRLTGPGLLDGSGDQLRELLFGELGGEVSLDQLRLRLLGLGLLRSVALAQRLGGVEPALALALQRGDLVTLALLLLGLERVDEHAQLADALALAGLHRDLHVLLDLLEDAHRLKRSRRRGCPVRLQAGRAQHEHEGGLRSGPRLADELGASPANDQPQRQAEDDRVVELPDPWQEVRDEVDRQREIAQNDDEGGATRPRDSLVPGKPRDEDEAVRDETGEGSGILAAPGGDQGGEGEQVEGDNNQENAPGPERDLLRLQHRQGSSTRSISPSGICKKRVPSSRKSPGSPVQRNR